MSFISWEVDAISGFLGPLPFLPRREKRCLCGCQEPRSGLLPNALQVVDLGSLEQLGFGCEKKRKNRKKPWFLTRFSRFNVEN